LPYLPVLHTPAEDLEFFSGQVLRADTVWVAECASAIVGFCAFGNGWLNHLYVMPSVHRAGIGSELLRIALRETEALRLWVFQQNAAAIAFYESHGFRLVRMTDGSENEEQVPDALYERAALGSL
jgi:ribosomal protein S18 acetylase RimI-like enzyme